MASTGATDRPGFAERVGQVWNRFWFAPGDPLPLGLLRIGVGLIAIYSHLAYSPDLVRYFGSGGLLPPEVTAAAEAGPARFSILDYVDTPAGLWWVHGIGLAVLTLWTVGLWTRWTGIASLVLVLSYIHRGVLLGSEFEWMLAPLMLYLCIGPAGACVSLDRWRERRAWKRDGRPAAAPLRWDATVALRLWQLHLCSAYFSMGLAKLLPGPPDLVQPWWNGEAVWWLAARPDSRLMDLTRYLCQQPAVVRVWTYLTLVFELGFPWAMLFRISRTVWLALAVVLWLGMAALTGHVGFALTMLAGSLAFVPATAWRRWLPGA